MTTANLFVLVILLLQVGAAVAYGWRSEWNMCLYWTGAVVINGAVLWRSL